MRTQRLRRAPGGNALRAAPWGAVHCTVLHPQEQCTVLCCTSRSNAPRHAAPLGAMRCPELQTTSQHPGGQRAAPRCTVGSNAMHCLAPTGVMRCTGLHTREQCTAQHCREQCTVPRRYRLHCTPGGTALHPGDQCTALHCTALQGATHCTVQRCTSLSNALHCAAPRGAMTCPALHAGSNALHRTATDFAAPQGAMHCLSTALRCAAPQGATRCLELQARQRCIAPCIMHCMLGSRCAVLHCAVMHPHCTPQSTALRHAALHHKERCAACAAHCRALHSPAPRYTARQAATCCPAQHCAVTSAALHP